MNVAVAIVEAEDDVAVTNLLEALEAGHFVNRGDVPCRWHLRHKNAPRGCQGGSCSLQSSAVAA
jgi:hypothetical protein